MTITYALMEKVCSTFYSPRDGWLISQLEDLAENSPDRVKILKKASVKKVIKDGDKVTGVEYEYQGKSVSYIASLTSGESSLTC